MKIASLNAAAPADNLTGNDGDGERTRLSPGNGPEMLATAAEPATSTRAVAGESSGASAQAALRGRLQPTTLSAGRPWAHSAG